jgi:hypothetical protein
VTKKNPTKFSFHGHCFRYPTKQKMFLCVPTKVKCSTSPKQNKKFCAKTKLNSSILTQQNQNKCAIVARQNKNES